MNSSLAKLATLSIGRIAIFGLVATVAYFFLLYDDGATITAEMQGIAASIAEENTKKIETERILKKEEEMRADVASLAKTYEAVKSKIPIDFETSELRTIVEQISSSSGLKISRFANVETEQLTSGAEQQDSSGDANLVEKVAIDYTFQGNYSEILKFMIQLSEVEKVIKVSQLKISSVDAPMPNTNLIVDAMIIGYRQAAVAQTPNKPADGTPAEASPQDSGAVE